MRDCSSARRSVENRPGLRPASPRRRGGPGTPPRPPPARCPALDRAARRGRRTKSCPRARRSSSQAPRRRGARARSPARARVSIGGASPGGKPEKKRPAHDPPRVTGRAASTTPARPWCCRRRAVRPRESQVRTRRRLSGAGGGARGTAAVKVRVNAERGPGRARLAQRERHLVGSRLEPAERELAGAVDEGDVADPRRVPASTATAGRMGPVASRTVPGVEDDPGGVVDRRLRTGKGHPPSSPATGERSRGWCR